MRTTTRLAQLLAVATLAACGGPADLQRLEIDPEVAQVTEHLDAQLRAVAVWYDGARRDVTAEAAWASGDGAVATVAGGAVQAGAPGATAVTATWGGLTTAARVEVLPAALLSLRLVAEEVALPAGTTTRLTVLGTYSDGTERDVTGLVAWSDDHGDDDPVSVDAEGRCHAEVEGAVTLHATLGGLEVEVALEVVPPVPVALAVAGLGAPLPEGAAVALAVTATMSDGSRRDATGLAAVEVSDRAVAVPGPGGTLVAVGPGAAEVRVSWLGAEATVTVEVVAAALREVAVRLVSGEPEAGHLLAFAATGTWSDGVTADVTGAVRWSTTDAEVAVAYEWLQPGAVLARRAGTADVVARDPATGVEGRYRLVVVRDD